MRGVARAAEVDPRLVHHYFESKEDLFVSALGFPARPAEIVAVVMSGPVAELGERLVRTVLQIWSSEEGRTGCWPSSAGHWPARRRPGCCASSSLASCWPGSPPRCRWTAVNYAPRWRRPNWSDWPWSGWW